jgi:lipoprotein-anchoring transpeptidase ErfK/SrfK
VAFAAAVAIALVSRGAGVSVSLGPNASSAAEDFAALPSSPASALHIGRPKQLRSTRFLSRWTIVRAPAIARARPSAKARAIAEIGTTTPDGTANVVEVLRAEVGADGALWVEVRLPVLPNGSVGWMRRQALGAYETVNTELLVDRRTLRATLYRNGNVIFSVAVGVGTDAWPTPAGRFTIRSELTRYASAFYGPVAFGTTARSAVLTDWPGGGFVGIHGTNEPELLPGRVSHGCIRMRNSDILRLAMLLPIGTPLTVR